MTDVPNPFRPAVLPAAGDATASVTDGAARDERDLLDSLEEDLAAVETAISALDRISADGQGGDRAAAEIRAAVSTERFGGGRG